MVSLKEVRTTKTDDQETKTSPSLPHPLRYDAAAQGHRTRAAWSDASRAIRHTLHGRRRRRYDRSRAHRAAHTAHKTPTVRRPRRPEIMRRTVKCGLLGGSDEFCERATDLVVVIGTAKETEDFRLGSSVAIAISLLRLLMFAVLRLSCLVTG